ncbi:MAG: 2OG-Fe(II) oxygenase [Egibacteraceae bacterium]
MLAPAFLSSFGIHLFEHWLDRSLCGEVRDEMLTVRAATATVAERGANPSEEVDAGHRRTKVAEVSEATRARVGERLEEIKPSLERAFSTTLSGFQRPQFLVYGEGDFFRAHIDNATHADAAEAIRSRRISFVAFLNAEADETAPGSYAGGALTFYGLLGERDTEAGAVGLPISGGPGMGVAFPSETVHAVTPVTRGERCTIVTWFC